MRPAIALFLLIVLSGCVGIPQGRVTQRGDAVVTEEVVVRRTYVVEEVVYADWCPAMTNCVANQRFYPPHYTPAMPAVAMPPFPNADPRLYGGVPVGVAPVMAAPYYGRGSSFQVWGGRGGHGAAFSSRGY